MPGGEENPEGRELGDIVGEVKRVLDDPRGTLRDAAESLKRRFRSQRSRPSGDEPTNKEGEE